VTFSTPALPKPHLGLIRNGEILDVDLAGRALQLSVPDQMLVLIEHYDRYYSALQAIIQKTGKRRFAEVRTWSEIGAAHALEHVQLDAPIPYPRKNIMCVGMNYSEHIQEAARVHGRSGRLPEHPVFFTKPPTSVNRPDGQIVIDPAVSTEIDWEVELAVIIGRVGKNISEEDALSHVFGYTVLNDVTARDLQTRHRQFFKGKSLDGSCPMGPSIVTADEIADPQALPIRLRVNGITKQDGNTSQMLFSVARLIAVLSLGMTLEPGDIIATGTPSGVGFSRVPAEFLQPGDVMEADIEGIGVLRNVVV
jgi:2-keto-4-pentenoate hydratase/2-oxohepta-3-ene-1,7-dioic acid hydratase in catechol pathway